MDIKKIVLLNQNENLPPRKTLTTDFVMFLKHDTKGIYVKSKKHGTTECIMIPWHQIKYVVYMEKLKN